jgi:hypothetical protein
MMFRSIYRQLSSHESYVNEVFLKESKNTDPGISFEPSQSQNPRSRCPSTNKSYGYPNNLQGVIYLSKDELRMNII